MKKMKINKCNKAKSIFSKPRTASSRKKTPQKGFFYGFHAVGER
jgi:hypothetical protein